MLKRREDILNKVQGFIDRFLNLNKESHIENITICAV